MAFVCLIQENNEKMIYENNSDFFVLINYVLFFVDVFTLEKLTKLISN